MNQKSIGKNDIIKELKELQAKDMKYSDGKILGSMCTEPHPFAKEVFCRFLDSNLGDPGLFKGTKTLEDKAIKLIGSLVSIDNPYGYIVTGGTEANLMAMRAARNYGKKFKKIENGELIIPRSAHFSFNKASDMLNLKLVEVDLDKNYKIDLNSVEDNINENTIAIVGIAGTTELGMVDPISDLSKIAVKEDIYLHVDAAFGGFSLPFLKDIGYDLGQFDFSLKGVSSMTVDPHKMGLAPIPAGGILFRNKISLDLMAVKAPYLTLKEQTTLAGTRLGASAAATYAIMRYLGREGYGKHVQKVMDNTNFLAKSLKELGYELVVEPELNIVAFNHPTMPPEFIAEELEKLGWIVSISSCPKALRIIVMTHLTKESLSNLLNDLDNINKNL